jgi:PAS domain S-box-containing protein
LKDERGNVITILSFVHDVSQRTKAEEQLKQSESQLAAAQQLAHVGSWYWDLRKREVTWSDELYRIFGLQPQEKKITPDIMEFIHQEDREWVLAAVQHSIKTLKTHNFYYKLIRADGKERTLYSCGEVKTDEKGTAIAVFGTTQDVTEQRQAEETLQNSHEEIRKLNEHLQKVREDERRSIAREIHDELGQQLTAIKMDVAWIDKKIPESESDLKQKLKNMIVLLDGSNQSIRRILSELRPRILDDHGLVEAIKWLGGQYTKTTGVPVRFSFPEKDIKVPEQVATTVFRLCQEAVTNIAKYAQAKDVFIYISITGENITVGIEDDGIGFDPATIQNKKSFGILGMKERVLAKGGNFALISLPGRGTKITANLPFS